MSTQMCLLIFLGNWNGHMTPYLQLSGAAHLWSPLKYCCTLLFMVSLVHALWYSSSLGPSEAVCCGCLVQFMLGDLWSSTLWLFGATHLWGILKQNFSHITLQMTHCILAPCSFVRTFETALSGSLVQFIRPFETVLCGSLAQYLCEVSLVVLSGSTNCFSETILCGSLFTRPFETKHCVSLVQLVNKTLWKGGSLA